MEGLHTSIFRMARVLFLTSLWPLLIVPWTLLGAWIGQTGVYLLKYVHLTALLGTFQPLMMRYVALHTLCTMLGFVPSLVLQVNIPEGLFPGGTEPARWLEVFTRLLLAGTMPTVMSFFSRSNFVRLVLVIGGS